MEAGVALVDIGGGTTDIAVYHDGIIRHTAVIPFGGNVVTHDIKEGCAILERHAEELKIKFGSALGDLAEDKKSVIIPGISGRDSKEISFKSLAYIIQSRMEEIIDAVMFEIENSEYADKLSAGVVITGGGALRVIYSTGALPYWYGRANWLPQCASGRQCSEDINHLCLQPVLA
jgi:cell division protein FtsA